MKKTILLSVILLTSLISKAQWKELGYPNTFLYANGDIYTICGDPSGNTYAAGIFNDGSPQLYNVVAKYDVNADSWYNLSLHANDPIQAVMSDASGNIYAAGIFTNSGNNHYVAKYNGSSWSELGGPNSFYAVADGSINTLCKDALGNIYAAGGVFNKNTPTPNLCVVKCNGSSWSEVGGFNSFSNFLASANSTASGIISICTDAAGNLYVAGKISNSSGKYFVAKYDGTSWSELGGNNSLAANGYINSICADASGNIYAAGVFTNGSGNRYVAKYNGTSWSELGGNNALAANYPILSICADASGKIYAAGAFEFGNGIKYVAKYNGTNWSIIGSTTDYLGNNLGHIGIINSIYVDALGHNIYAGGTFSEQNLDRYVGIYQVCNPNSQASVSVNGCTITCTTAANSYQWDSAGVVINGATSSSYTVKATGVYSVTITDANGCVYSSSSTNVNCNNNIGINNLHSTNSIKAYPNPTNTATTITLTKPVDNATIKLINITGQTVFEKQNQTGDHFNLDISQQAKGIYFIEVNERGNVYRGKVVKE